MGGFCVGGRHAMLFFLGFWRGSLFGSLNGNLDIPQRSLKLKHSASRRESPVAFKETSLPPKKKPRPRPNHKPQALNPTPLRLRHARGYGDSRGFGGTSGWVPSKFQVSGVGGVGGLRVQGGG